MDSFATRRPRQTRFGFRIMAGILAAIVLLISLPSALYQARSGTAGDWLMVLCCLVAGVGLAVGARTGRWFNSPE